MTREAHDLKVWPQFFEAIASGAKTFELRRNDRSFSVGDVLRLREWDLNTQTYTGREAQRVITYILADSPWDVIQDGYVILALATPPAGETPQGEAHYSGKRSEGFWARINATDDLELYKLGCQLQEAEHAVLSRLRATPDRSEG